MGLSSKMVPTLSAELLLAGFAAPDAPRGDDSYRDDSAVGATNTVWPAHMYDEVERSVRIGEVLDGFEKSGRLLHTTTVTR